MQNQAQSKSNQEIVAQFILDDPAQQNVQKVEPKTNAKLPQQIYEQGTQLMKDQKYFEASECFQKSIKSFEQLVNKNELSKQQIQQIMADVMIPVYADLSQCCLELNQRESAIQLCNNVLSYDNSHIKSRLTKASAERKLSKYSQAIADYKMVSQLDPTMEMQCERLIQQCYDDESSQKQSQENNAFQKVGTNENENKLQYQQNSQIEYDGDVETEENVEEQKIQGKVSKMVVIQKMIDGAINFWKKLFGSG